MNTTTTHVHVSVLAAECEAINLYRELESWFTDRNFDELASLCARLATWHRDAYIRLAGTDERIPVETLRAAAVPWVSRTAQGRRPREFLFRLASPAQLIDLALETEQSEECAAKLRSAKCKLGPLNWETAIASGTDPSLALGAERRLRRVTT